MEEALKDLIAKIRLLSDTEFNDEQKISVESDIINIITQQPQLLVLPYNNNKDLTRDVRHCVGSPLLWMLTYHRSSLILETLNIFMNNFSVEKFLSLECLYDNVRYNLVQIANQFDIVDNGEKIVSRVKIILDYLWGKTKNPYLIISDYDTNGTKKPVYLFLSYPIQEIFNEIINTDVRLKLLLPHLTNNNELINPLALTPIYDSLSNRQYLFLENPVNGINYTIGMPAQNSSGDVYHVLSYLALANYHRCSLPAVYTLYDTDQTSTQSDRSINIAQALGFNIIKSQNSSINSNQSNVREKVLRTALGNQNLINQKTTTLLIAKHICEYGRDKTVSIIQERLIASLRQYQKMFSPLINNVLSEIKKQYLAAKNSSYSGIVLINKRFSSGANDELNLSNEVENLIKHALEQEKIFYWLLSTSESNNPVNKVTNIFGGQAVNDAHKKIFHLLLLDALLSLPDLIGVIGNTSGILDITSFIGFNVLDIHYFSKMNVGEKFKDQEYRLLSQYPFMSVLSIEKDNEGNTDQHQIYRQLLIWLQAKGKIRIFPAFFKENNLKVANYHPAIKSIKEGNKYQHDNERIDFSGYISQVHKLPRTNEGGKSNNTPDKWYVNLTAYSVLHNLFPWFFELDSKLHQEIKHQTYHGGNNYQGFSNLKPYLNWDEPKAVNDVVEDNLIDEIKKLSLENKKQNEAADGDDLQPFTETEWLSDSHMREIGTYIQAQSNLNNIRYSALALNSHISNANNYGLLETALTEWLQASDNERFFAVAINCFLKEKDYQEAKSKNSNSNISGNHWVYALFERKTTGKIRVYIIDPADNSVHYVKEEVIKMLNQLGKPNTFISDYNAGIQQDSINCGIWVLKFFERTLFNITEGRQPLSEDLSEFTDEVNNQVANYENRITSLRNEYRAIYENIQQNHNVNLTQAIQQTENTKQETSEQTTSTNNALHYIGLYGKNRSQNEVIVSNNAISGQTTPSNTSS